jgi:hypothetical protein
MGRTAPAAKQAVTAVLGVAALTGYLLVSGALDPVLQEAVTLAGKRHDATAPADAQPQVAPVADWQYFDDRPEWSPLRLVATGPDAPSPPVPPTRPQVAPAENPHHWQFSGPAPMPRHTLRPMTSCTQPHGPGHDMPLLTATPGKGSATISWWDLGDPDTQGYRVDALPSSQRGTVTQTNVAAPKTCKSVSVTIGGLKSGVSYQFMLLATNQSRVQTHTYRISRGQTGTVLIG